MRDRTVSDTPHIQSEPLWWSIASSWLALKPWVKAWLFFLNGVFLSSLVFWPDPVARWTIVAYVVSGPLLLGLMVYQRGLTRLLGLAHIIPWMPLVVYLVVRLTSQLSGPQITHITQPALFYYLLVLLVSVVICLAFDIIDFVRWIAGERYVMGSPEAVRVGASLPAPPRRVNGREDR